MRRQFVQQLSSGSGQISAGTNETFASLKLREILLYLLRQLVLGVSTGQNGDILSLTVTTVMVYAIFTLGGSPTGKTLTLDFGTAFADAELQIIATVNRSVAGSKTKTLNSSQTLALLHNQLFNQVLLV